MSYTYLQGQEVVSSADYCWDIDPCALLNMTSMQGGSLLQDNRMDVCQCFQYGMMYPHSTGGHGKVKPMSCVVDFPARILVALGKAKESMVKEAASGGIWHELLMRYNLNTCLLRTHHCLFEEDLLMSSVVLPAWGMMQDGVFLERMILEVGISVSDAGYWPTPLKEEGPGGKHKKLTDVIAIKEGFRPRYYNMDGMEGRKVFTGKANPDWVEWLMGWPVGWTNDCKELETDRFQSWRQQHGLY